MLKTITTLRNVSTLQNIVKASVPVSVNQRCYSRLYEPDYLEALKPKYPEYNVLDFQIKGYDFPVLENYQRVLHSYAEALDLEVTECWAQPPQHVQVQRFKPLSAVVEAEYKLPIYERVIQISDIQAPIYPLLLRIAQAALPEGVTLNVLEHTEDEEERRYVPDKDLIELRQQLDDLGGPILSGKRK